LQPIALKLGCSISIQERSTLKSNLKKSIYRKILECKCKLDSRVGAEPVSSYERQERQKAKREENAEDFMIKNIL